jgi:uncharacterized protein
VEFEYDPIKSEANKRKHGINLLEAAALWNDPRALLIGLEYKEEQRFGLIAKLEDKLWIAIFTTRSERIRIISVRRARPDESDRYGQEQSQDN